MGRPTPPPQSPPPPRNPTTHEDPVTDNVTTVRAAMPLRPAATLTTVPDEDDTTWDERGDAEAVLTWLRDNLPAGTIAHLRRNL